MKVKIDNFDRLDLFNHYNGKSNPFIFVTTKVDITNVYNKCKKYYASIAYFISKAVNEIDNFKYRFEEGNFYKYDTINVNFTYRLENKIGFFTIDYKDKYQECLEEYLRMQKLFLEDNLNNNITDEGEIWVSYVPWFNFNSVIPPYDKKITIPQFIWDKFSFENGRCYINLMIMAHHGFVDGYHIGLFFEKLNNMLENIDLYID